MPRKKSIPREDVTPALLKFREKRKWQISLRRYVIEKSPCPSYAPYFSLDIQKIREWIECQFTDGIGWADFGKKWQFDHIIPVTYFDFSNDSELKMCWNFTNIRVASFQRNKDRGNRLDILAAKNYFSELYEKTHYKPCLHLLQKIDKIEISELLSTENQQSFIRNNRTYLELIENYSVFEFEMLNSGRSIEDVQKEMEFFRKIGN